MKYGLTLASISLALFIASPAFATDQDDAELGIEMKKSQRSVSVAETLDRSNTKLHHYEKAKESVAEIFTGAPQSPDAPKPPAPVRTIDLKNGQSLTGTVGEHDKNGFWIEVAPGANVYVRNDEIKEDTKPAAK